MLRFDGKVAIVTGGGRGLGRSHALLLASRGASVVVNDFGSSAAGVGSDSSPADDVVAEIIAANGKAVANYDNVVTGAEAIVQTAIEAFGRLDIVVNNAGINHMTPFGPDAIEGIRKHMEVNFFGTAAVTAAAWPHLVASGAGRVVNTASPTLVGFEHQSAYVASKAAIFSFTRTLSMEAIGVGVRVNAIAPTAYTRMAAEAEIPDELKQTLEKSMTTAMVSPTVAYLAHEDCSITGETLLSQGGLMQRFALSMNEGYNNPEVTPEDIKANLEAILDDSTSKPVGIIGSENEGSLLDLFS
ncbi:SDR family NAD(P)-dependent oxidoreductase [Nocardia sp. NPDC051833]|uniref:SDR family NAD(P)-dependent oxidoreductase n=1 Tax=Nocardia sp. NPDC051833 TaxID=3155674 RepID=UPI00341EBB2B